MLIVMPSDPTTYKASEYLNSIPTPHQILEIPDELGYKTGATVGLYLDGEHADDIMKDLSAHGFVIMRVFKSFKLA